MTRQHITLLRRAMFQRMLLLAICGLTVQASAAPPKLAPAKPESVGMDSGRLQMIDAVVNEGIRRERMPGAVVVVGRRGKIVLSKAYGHKSVMPEKTPMTVDTVFDMASLTKPIATATSIMKLIEQGELQLQDPLAKYLPAFGANGKDKITVFQLLTHQGGLTPDNRLSDYDDGPEAAMRRIDELPTIAEPGTRFIYSDVGFIVLAHLVEKISGRNVHEFSQEECFGPLGMTETGFLPAASLRDRAAPTQQRDGKWMRGEVHDPRAYRLKGIAGHAGLFSTVSDLAVYAQMMAAGGTYQGVEILTSKTVATMTEGRQVQYGLRGLGWDVRSGYSSNRGDLLSSHAFGHGGFTGTSFWVDPELELFVIFLSNRVHPDGKGSINSIAGRVGTIAAAAIFDGDQKNDESQVLTGIDVLQADGFRPLRNGRVGLITNQTGVDRRGKSTIEILHRTPEVNLTALFSPEHGIAGKLDQANIADGREPETGLEFYSLYGKTRIPTAESLAEIDILVFDIQDIGTRFYTYISTMGGAMRAAAENDVRFVVLDRPNPINGMDVNGPMLDAGKESFVAYHHLPVRHGMTVGELARMFRAELKLDLDLHVVPIQNWKRSDFHDATGLPWINPSPNMRNLNQALLYPGIGLLETTNLSVGRGTDTPFEVIGAPWINGITFARELNDLGLSGIRFVPIRFTPRASKFQGKMCGGVQLLITDRHHLTPVNTGLHIARTLRMLYGDDWEINRYSRLLASDRTLMALRQKKTVDEIEAFNRPTLEAFLKRRAEYLLYD